MSKVMLVEDDPTMLSLLTTLLEFEGFQVAKLKRDADIGQALRQMQQEAPDLLILDIHLGKINGLDLLRQVRRNVELCRVPVLVSSGIDSSLESEIEGADAFILKPYMPDDLIQKIRQLIGKE
jgi:DNA-binding response OmpR family regulator